MYIYNTPPKKHQINKQKVFTLIFRYANICSSAGDTATNQGNRDMTNNTFNGYESYNHWNTALWINNDQRFYNLLKNKVELVVYMACTKSQAVYEILRELPEQTPDGATWEADTILDLVTEQYDEQLQYS